MFSDLECDYINPIDLCNKLNQVSHGRQYHASYACNLTRCNPVVRPARVGLPRILDDTVPTVRAMDGIHSKCTTGRLQCEQVRRASYVALRCVGGGRYRYHETDDTNSSFLEPLSCHLIPQSRQRESYVRRDRDLPDTGHAQERVLHKTRLLLGLILLLPIPVRIQFKLMF